MKTLAALFVVAALALSACDAGPDFGTDGQINMRGDVGGAAGAGGAGGAGGAAPAYVPDPAPTCADPAAGVVATDIPCGGDGAGAIPSFNASGTQCYSCPGYTVPDMGCNIRIPAAISGGQLIHGPRDLFCAPACDPTLCHVK